MDRPGVNFIFNSDEVIESGSARLDKVISLYFSENDDVEDLSRSKVSRFIKQGFVKLDEQISSKASKLVESGSVIQILVPTEEDSFLTPDPSVELDIIHEDRSILVVNKPAGLVVHPGAGNKNGTLANGLVAYLENQKNSPGGDSLRPGIVHRLDKDTTGLMVIAKSDRSFQKLQRQFLPPRTIHRTYLALTRNIPALSDQTISAPIGRDRLNRLKMATRNDGKEAVTHWKIRKELKRGFLLELKLETGRTHQIRVHLAEFGAPIVGDSLYGEAYGSLPAEMQKITRDFGRQALHAESLKFIHPENQEEVSFVAPLPTGLKNLFNAYDK